MPRKSSLQQTVQHKSVPQVVLSKPSLGQTIKDGIAFGVGNAIAHKLVNSIMSSDPSVKDKEYEKCMKEHNDKSICDK